jgi:hypothetical protein
VGTFHTNGWTKFISGQIFTFWGQPLTNKIQHILAWHNLAQTSPGPQKLGFWPFFILFFYTSVDNSKIEKLTKLPYVPLKS